jgi:hypothetical protein
VRQVAVRALQQESVLLVSLLAWLQVAVLPVSVQPQIVLRAAVQVPQLVSGLRQV